MSRKAKLFTALTVIMAIMTVSGATLLASATSGTQNDPLVTLSYLTDKFKPQIMSEMSAEIINAQNNLTSEFNAKISTLQASGGAVTAPEKADVFSVVTLSSGQTLTCSVGTELMLRIGTASASGTSPALVNTTAGTTIETGAALVTNNMYMVTIEGNSVKATAATVRILVRGNYTVS